MKRIQIGAVVALSLWFAACMRTLPSSLRHEIADEHSKIQRADQEIQRAEQTVNRDIQGNPDLFRGTTAPAQWKAEFASAHEKLRTAEETDRDLTELSGRNRADSLPEAEHLLAKERALLEAAQGETREASGEAAKWVNFKQDLPRNLEQMKQAYEAVHSTDLAPLSKTVEQAERDWPAKKDFLNSRLTALLDVPKSAENEWQATAAARQKALTGQISDPELASVIQASDALSQDENKLRTGSDALRELSGQLYNSWDKILVDLDEPDHGRDQMYRERIRTVSTHITDAASKQSETSSSEQWVAVTEPQFHAVENDVGMAIAHKSAGTFDSEAITTPEPAGFAYIAPESQGSNQYGYWNHDGGRSVWTWLPQYLLLRELLWNHSYRPVVLDEYRGYHSAEQMGRTYYGQSTPASLPRYGTHGTFTRTTYANSRYVQSGGFKGSAYSSHGSIDRPSTFGSEHANQRSSPGWNDKSAGRRFGSGAGSPSGRRFGQSGGGRSFGRGFGRRR